MKHRLEWIFILILAYAVVFSAAMPARAHEEVIYPVRPLEKRDLDSLVDRARKSILGHFRACAEVMRNGDTEQDSPDYGEDQQGTDLSEWSYYGQCRITHYCACEICCGEWATGCTASGVLATANHTVATGEDLPFGTELLINGEVYVVEDRGVDCGCVDIFVDDHEDALNRGMFYTDVYVRL